MTKMQPGFAGWELNDRLVKQIEFIMEIDKAKSILRRTYVDGGSRRENDAEHTWHLAVMAVVLLEHANDSQIDLLKVIKMLLIHDVVEIDAGDTFAYDAAGHDDKAEREQAAADRIFGMLPADQCVEFMTLWHEFEARETAEARYAAALDRLHPMMLNYGTEGASWKEHHISADMVLKRNAQIADGAEPLWNLARNIVEESVRQGWIKERREV